MKHQKNSLALGLKRFAGVILTITCFLTSVAVGQTHKGVPIASAADNVSPPASCYSSRKGGASAVKLHTVLLIDRTTPKKGLAWRDFTASVEYALNAPGQRVVLLPFAGLAPGQTFARALDVVIPPPIAAAEREDMVIAEYNRLQRCIARTHQQAKQSMTALLKKMADEDGAPLERSEVLFALESVLADFGFGSNIPLRLLIFSDGLQNGSGFTFYTRGAVRAIEPERELLRWKPQGANASMHPNTRVWWWGLLAQDEAAQGRLNTGPVYLSADLLASYKNFWLGVLARLGVGVSKVEIGPTLNNPDLKM
ncbi:MAG: hypothetical protein ACKOF9_01440 [Burkholderiales bacterium]